MLQSLSSEAPFRCPPSARPVTPCRSAPNGFSPPPGLRVKVGILASPAWSTRPFAISSISSARRPTSALGRIFGLQHGFVFIFRTR